METYDQPPDADDPGEPHVAPITNYELENFFYGDNCLGAALYYKTMYPGFTDDRCRAMEAFSNGVTPK